MKEDKKKLLLVYNPCSGKGTIVQKIASIIDIYTKAGFMVTAYPTQKALDAMQIVSDNSLDFDQVVCSGGDGTLNEVVTGMMNREKKIPVGYIPAGSTNDYANSLGLPKNFMEAAKVAIGEGRFKSDIGLFGDRYFVYVAAFGLFSAVSYMTKQEMKNILGHSAYIIEGMKSLTNIPKYHITVESEDQHLEGDYILGMVSNSVSIGGFKKLFGKSVALDDGYYELTLARQPKNISEFQELLTCFLSGKLQEASIVESIKISNARISCDQPLAWSLDGEFGGEFTEIDIKNCKQALELVI